MNKKIAIGALALMGAIPVSNALAASVVYETRQINAGVNNTDYRASWNAQSTAITTQTLADFNGATIPGASGGFSHLAIAFSAAAGSQWGFQLAPDAGHGGALYLNGALLDRDTNDLWWSGNWSATAEILSAAGLTLTAGNHLLEGYWAEGCCDGAQGARFTTDGSHWQSTQSLANPVPIPAAVWLFGSSLAGLMGLAHRRNRAVAA